MRETMVQRLKLTLAPPVWWALASSVRLARTTRPPGPVPAPVIFACLHRDFIPAILYVQPARPSLLVSNSPDGDILTRTLARGGYRFVRGSTGPDGGKAFVGLLAELRRGFHVGVAVDGPKGPYGIVHDGVIQLSRRADCPIVPLGVRCTKPRVLGTWDRTVVPLPFSGVQVAEGEPLQVPASADGAELERWRQLVQETMRMLHRFPAGKISDLTCESPEGSEPCVP